ncbi:MAG: hypothetical protein CMJ39_05525 [Phycisphaerae bacterium]|nr:hypothetical protein [Phycisphaerae bacterium]|tara:strand:- start:37 stop:318 length:282 start_codon:yes stop_codon:yes gene_type:complete
MAIILLIFIGIFITLLVSLAIVSRGDSAMAPFAKALLALLLGLMALFCIYGFLASFEPSENALAFKIGYAVIFVILTGLLVWTLRPRKAIGRR